MATLRELVSRLLDGTPMTVPQLILAIREKAPAVEVWREGLEHLLEVGQREGIFELTDGRWSYVARVASNLTQEVFEDPALTRDDPGERISRTGYVGEDATDFITHIINSIPPHTKEEQRDLARRRDLCSALDDDEGAKQHCWSLTWGSARLAHHIASKYRMPGMERCDLVMWALLGLFRAAEQWDPEIAAFSTYATWWGRQSVTRALADHGRLVRVPVHAHEKWLKARKKIQAAEEQGMVPDLGLVAREVDLPEPMLLAVLRASAPYLELEDLSRFEHHLEDSRASGIPVSPERKRLVLLFRHLAEDLTDSLGIGTDSDFAGWLSTKERIQTAVKELDDQARTVLQLRFGLNSSSPTHTLQEIGDVLGVTRERVRQIEAKALEVLEGILE